MKENIKNNILPKIKSNKVPIAILLAGMMVAGVMLYKDRNVTSRAQSNGAQVAGAATQITAIEEAVVPSAGVVLPVVWGDLGAKLISTGVIDADKFTALYTQRGDFTDEYKKLLLEKSDDNLKITPNNAGYLLNLFWALGLGNRNSILDAGEMSDPKYGGAGRFASTGGWTMASGDTMNHFSKHKFFNLTPDQQALVDRVSKGIYRPCCGNSVHFPDCNHGMAMLGLLELMASQGTSEQVMWKTALTVNSYWFPGTYVTIATYMKNKGVEWKDVNSQEMLSAGYSSAQGFAKISAQVVKPEQQQGGSGCSV